MNFYFLWLKRVLFSSKNLFQANALFSLFALILAVAILTIALLFFNGFSLGLQKTLIEKQGHLRIDINTNVSQEYLLNHIKKYQKYFSYSAKFLSFEALILHKKNFKAVVVKAIQDDKLFRISVLKNHILKKQFHLKNKHIFVGQALAQDLKLGIGSEFILLVSNNKQVYLSKKKETYKLGAIIDFGRYEFNSRLVIMPLSFASYLDFNSISGINIWLKNPKQSLALKHKMQQDLGSDFIISYWKDLDRSFFKIIESDKNIIFFILMLLILIAGFNISSSLFVQVFKKTKEISILKVMGAQNSTIRNIFLLNAGVLGLIGISLGLCLGWGICYILIALQNVWHFLPTEIYKINDIVLDWRQADVARIFIMSLILVIVSSFFPARRAYKMTIKHGLSHE